VRPDVAAGAQELPLIPAKSWGEVFADRNREALSTAILRYVRSRRWFGAKARTVSALRIDERVPISRDSGFIVVLEIEYTDGEPDRYLLPVAMAQARRADEPERTTTLIARLRDGCLLYEPVADERFGNALLDIVGRRKRLKGRTGMLSGSPTRQFKELRDGGELHAQVLKAEQSNTAIVYGERLFLKLFRRLE